MKPWRLALIYAFVIITILNEIHHNVVVSYSGQRDRRADTDPDTQVARVYDALIALGDGVGLGHIWRMYTPVPRWLRQVEWYAMSPEGSWVRVPYPDLLGEYRASRSIWASLLWDFKRARINDNYMIYAYDETLLSAYLAHHRSQMIEALGWDPHAIRVLVRTAPIPAPEVWDGWTPRDARLDEVLSDQVFAR